LARGRKRPKAVCRQQQFCLIIFGYQGQGVPLNN
jgi:hypothetical protein